MPVFSPDGKKLAFSSDRLHDFVQIADEIRIVSLHNLRIWHTIKGLQEHSRFLGLKWSPNGKYIIYQVIDSGNRGLESNIAVPLSGVCMKEYWMVCLNPYSFMIGRVERMPLNLKIG